MKIRFNIHYKTNWGENLFICGSHPALGNWNTEKAVNMRYVGGELWQYELELHAENAIEYKYFYRDSQRQVFWEGGENRRLTTMNKSFTLINDNWQPFFDQNRVLHSKAFTDVIMKPEKKDAPLKDSRAKKSLRLTIEAPRIGPGFAIAVLGDSPLLGNWSQPRIMNNNAYPLWQLNLNVTKASFPLEYKYVIVELATKKVVTWEIGFNRKLQHPDEVCDECLQLQHDLPFRYPVGNWKGAGVSIPVFSIRTNDSFGVGEFNDLKKLADWCQLTGLNMIQLLPINDTTANHSWSDSYPYKSITVKALHPMYLHLPALGEPADKAMVREFEQLKETVNKLDALDYVEVNRHKRRYITAVFEEQWDELSQSNTYRTFFEDNKDWLIPYASFSYLRDKYETSKYHEWGEYASCTAEKMASLCDPDQPHYKKVAIYYFMQYHLDKQLREAVTYMHDKRICLKGDLPIGISPNSVEAWTEPELFNLGCQAGAPPDDFSAVGQNWELPTYNWEVMANDQYLWWRKRLQMMERYFDAYRIDHILGFFRIWEIQTKHKHGLLGYFNPALPFSVQEIEEKGIWFDHDRFVKPYIRGHFLADFFGAYVNEVRDKYLNETDYNEFELKPEFDTQAKIWNHFTPENMEAKLDFKNLTIRDGLMGLLNEVLFIRDPYSAHEAYHPRIAFHFTYAYKELPKETKEVLNDLYIHFFYKRHDQFWKNEAMTKLPPIVHASNMLVCGEDLGMVPDSVPEVMTALNILSLEIQRMPKNPRIAFGHPADAPYLCVCTTSTHDMSSIRGWWEENREKTQAFYRHMLGHNDYAPFFAEPWVCYEIIRQHMHSPAMWTIFPIQDLFAMDGQIRWDQTTREQINVPGNPNNKWQYRMHISLEELMDASSFNETIRELLKQSGRGLPY